MVSQPELELIHISEVFPALYLSVIFKPCLFLFGNVDDYLYENENPLENSQNL